MEMNKNIQLLKTFVGIDNYNFERHLLLGWLGAANSTARGSPNFPAGPKDLISDGQFVEDKKKKPTIQRPQLQLGSITIGQPPREGAD